jgi:DNA polymerase/3'-5' exonuclease PolX
MSTGLRLSLLQAEAVASRLVTLLRPGCSRIEIAGSIRRRRPDVGDVEIVAVPRFEDGIPASMFDPPPKVSALDSIFALAFESGVLAPHPERPANGERYKRLWIPKPGIQLDLFLVAPPAEWGPIFTIRTGPAAFSQRLVTALLDKGWRCHEGRVIGKRGETVPCPEERDFFAACGEPWTEPEVRRA